MDRRDPLLSHQYEAVSALANNFNEVTVITGRSGDVPVNSKIKIVTTDWAQGDYLGNLFRFFSRALPIVIRGNFGSVFYHMTDLQCALLSPFVWLRRKRQYLWYAHTFKSRYLVFSSWWVTKIITSTAGSCPLSGPKVKPIGQAIDEGKFSVLPFDELNLSKLIHIGRFDKSKNIELLIDAARELRKTYLDISLTLVGTPANEESRMWAQNLVLRTGQDVRDGWLKYKDSIPRDNFRQEVAQNGCFFHGYIGSLDKTLVESTMLRVPVVTLNPEYLGIFGSWSKSTDTSLSNEYRALRSATQVDIEIELDRRLEIVREEHSLKHWIKELTSLLE